MTRAAFDWTRPACYDCGMSASVLLTFGREIELAEWERVAAEVGLAHRPEIFPSNVWRLATHDVEVRWGWPTEEDARKRMKPAKARGAQVSSYHNSDLPTNARLVASLEARLAAVPEIVPNDLVPYLEAARAGVGA